MRFARNSILLVLGLPSAHAYCRFRFQILLNRWDNPLCIGAPPMDSKDPHTGVRVHEGKCRDWNDEKTFDAFVVQWMPNVDGEDPGCHKPCDVLVYDTKHCGRPDGVKIKESPQRYPIYNIGVNEDTHWGKCQSFQTQNITAKGRSVELRCGRKWFDYSANGPAVLSSNQTQAQPPADRE